jgi:uncharacterized membrane protein
MDSTYFHLVLTHFPIIGTLFGIVLLAYGIYSKNDLFNKAGLITFIISALVGIPAFLTGDGAAEALKQLKSIPGTLIDAHEELGEKAIWVIEALGLLSLIALFLDYKKDKRFRIACTIILILSILTFVLMIVVGYTGGQIRLSELKLTSSQFFLQ